MSALLNTAFLIVPNAVEKPLKNIGKRLLMHEVSGRYVIPDILNHEYRTMSPSLGIVLQDDYKKLRDPLGFAKDYVDENMYTFVGDRKLIGNNKIYFGDGDTPVVEHAARGDRFIPSEEREVVARRITEMNNPEHGFENGAIRIRKEDLDYADIISGMYNEVKYDGTLPYMDFEHVFMREPMTKDEEKVLNFFEQVNMPHTMYKGDGKNAAFNRLIAIAENTDKYRFADGGELYRDFKSVKQRKDYKPNKIQRFIQDKIGPWHYPNPIGVHGDFSRFYFGRPSENDTFYLSKYAPSKSKDANAVYYGVKDPKFLHDFIYLYNSSPDLLTNIGSKVIDGYRARTTSDKDTNYVGDNIERYYPSGDLYGQRELSPSMKTYKLSDSVGALGNFTVGRGKDDKGEYLSYYDLWDVDRTAEKYNLAKPYEIYDRIYGTFDKDGIFHPEGELPAARVTANRKPDGGGIHIKPENKGKFNATKARTGKTTEELTHSSNPLTRKRAIFAQNAAKWNHHAEGGPLGYGYNTGYLYPAPPVQPKVPVVASVPDAIDYDELKRRQYYIESRFDDKAVSHAGARGAYQIMPITLEDYTKRTGETGDLNDYKFNEKIRDFYMNRHLNSSWATKNDQSEYNRAAKSLAAYNWGAGNLLGYLEKQKASGADIYKDTKWIEGLPKETRNYIRFILDKQDIGNKITNDAYEKAKKRRFGYGGLLYKYSPEQIKAAMEALKQSK